MNALNQFENVSGIKITQKKHWEIFSFLCFIELILSFSYLGNIQISSISVSTMHILVLVAAMFFGPLEAILISVIYSLLSIWSATFASPDTLEIFFSPFKSGKPMESLLIAAGSRIVFALLSGIIFRLYFLKPRKKPLVLISLFSSITTLILSVIVSISLVLFFDIDPNLITSGLSISFFMNNFLLYAITIALMILFYRVVHNEKTHNILRITDGIYEEQIQYKKPNDKHAILLYVILGVVLGIVFVHFVVYIPQYVPEEGTTEDYSGYYRWVLNLVFEFMTGFIGVFGVFVLSIAWTREYFLAKSFLAEIRAQENAQIANKAKTDFLFNISHDIRTPMNAIVGYTDMAMNHEREYKKTHNFLLKIRTSCGHLLSMINDMLELGRIESGKMEITPMPVDIRASLNNVIEMCHDLAASKEIVFKYDIYIQDSPFLYVDEFHVNQVILNLVSNAIKYSSSGSVVEFFVEQVGKQDKDVIRLRFSVIDHGIGMSEEFQSHLFEEPTETESGEEKTAKARLGLSIVKKVVDLSGGQIHVLSKVEEGTTFIVDIPFKVMSKEEENEFLNQNSEKNVEVDKAIFKGKRVLVVEDNKLNREIIHDILTDVDMNVFDATDGVEAVNFITENGPESVDFVLMDIQMPNMDGYEATRKIRELYPDSELPILALSANAFAEDKEASLKAGMNDHMAKPININELYRIIAKYL